MKERSESYRYFYRFNLNTAVFRVNIQTLERVSYMTFGAVRKSLKVPAFLLDVSISMKVGGIASNGAYFVSDQKWIDCATLVHRVVKNVILGERLNS